MAMKRAKAKEIDLSKLKSAALILLSLGLILAIVSTTVSKLTPVCYSNTYTFMSQRLSDAGGRCEYCLVVDAVTVGSTHIDSFYFETTTKLLSYRPGQMITMQWCPSKGDWHITGVRKA